MTSHRCHDHTYCLRVGSHGVSPGRADSHNGLERKRRPGQIQGMLKSVLCDNRKFVIFIFVFALVVRITFVLSLKNKFYFSDSLDYDDCSVAILKGEGFGEYKRSPLYPVFMSSVYLIFGQRNLVALRIIESIIGSFLCVILFFIGKYIFNDEVGKLSSLFSVLYPMFIFITGLQYPTLLGTFLIAFGIYHTIFLNIYKKIYISMMIGILFGLAALTIAPTAILIICVIFWLLFFSDMERYEILLHCFIIIMFFSLTLTPWTMRNFNYYDRFIPIEHGAVRHLPYYDSANVPDYKISHSVTEKIISIKENIPVFLQDYAGKFLDFWRFFPNLASSDPQYNLKIYQKDKRIINKNIFSLSKWKDIIVPLAFGNVMLFAIFGCFFIHAHFKKVLLLIFPILTLALTYSFFITTIRYRIPIEPFMLIIAAHGVGSLYDRVKGNSPSDSLPHSSHLSKRSAL
jgi:4-amino-4-deoxy-L-arabinose transferase-like glycosyltransferase